MRLYLSKDEGILLQSIISHELQSLIEHPFVMSSIFSVDKRIDMLYSMCYRIENCLKLQKSGYNRKEKIW